MIIWSGWGILAPFIIVAGIFGVCAAGNSFFGPEYSLAHSWVLGAGFAVGGFLCWLFGRFLYSRGSRVLVDKASGREVNVGPSHTLFFIPMHWLGVLAMVIAIPVCIYGFPEPSRTKRARAGVESGAHSRQFASAAEAQRAAVRLYPDLGVAGSDFNKRFVALHLKYQQERPKLFQENNWPLVIAEEVSKTLKSE